MKPPAFIKAKKIVSDEHGHIGLEAGIGRIPAYGEEGFRSTVEGKVRFRRARDIAKKFASFFKGSTEIEKIESQIKKKLVAERKRIPAREEEEKPPLGI